MEPKRVELDAEGHLAERKSVPNHGGPRVVAAAEAEPAAAPPVNRRLDPETARAALDAVAWWGRTMGQEAIEGIAAGVERYRRTGQASRAFIDSLVDLGERAAELGALVRASETTLYERADLGQDLARVKAMYDEAGGELAIVFEGLGVVGVLPPENA